MDTGTFVERLASTSIGETYNQYACGERSALLRTRLSTYLGTHADSPILLMGEAPGYRGARISGIPFTSERQLTGCGPTEATATIVQRALGELELADNVLLWNVVPTHPGTSSSNRAPTRDEIEQGVVFARQLARGRRVIAVGRVAESAFTAVYVRHPSHGGACDFQAQLVQALADFVAQSHKELIPT